MWCAKIFVAFALFAGLTTIDAKFPKGRLLTPQEGCGFSQVALNRIVGGTAAKPDAWPWFARIGFQSLLNKSKIIYQCGGSLITSRHVLSAGHCILQNLVQVRFGEHDISKPSPHIVDVNVVRVEIHERFSKPFMTNDIAILYLEHDVDFSDHIKPICLPLDPPLAERDLLDANAFVIGYGRQNASDCLSEPKILQQVQLPIHDNEVCKKAFKKVRLFISNAQFDEKALCAGNLAGNEDSCKGDSGGPLMLPIRVDGSYSFYQFGIISYGKDCGKPDMPALYTRVSYYSDWIREKLAL